MRGAQSFLQSAQNPDGGWGYKLGGMSFVEPTAAVIVALAKARDSERARRDGIRFLEGLQHSDGGWGIAALDDESGWMTAWAVLALAGENALAAQRGADWLLSAAGIRITEPDEAAAIKETLHIDSSITGFPWQLGDAAWVFPTGLALLALAEAGRAQHPRVQEALSYLLDRAVSSGGWNIGNPFMFTGEIPPTVENTVIALLALWRLGIENRVTKLAEDWLKRAPSPTAWENAWRALYWSTVGKPDKGLEQTLLTYQRENGSWDGNPFTTAIALMGISAAGGQSE